MPLDTQQIDTRDFETLLREARLRIPTYTPEWTDFNDSDPGMTLVQLFAWLTEMMLYEINRVPERAHVNFLKLLGQELEPARPATAHLTFAAQEGAARIGSIPPRTRVLGTPPDGGEPLIFETVQGLDLIRPRLESIRVFNGAGYEPASRRFPPFGWSPQPGNALYLGFAVPDVAAPPPGRPFPQQMRFRVVVDRGGQGSGLMRCSELRRPPPPPATLVWEYNDGAAAPRWRPLDVFEDASVAFTRDGDIVLEGPPETIPLSLAANVDERRYWLRCRIVAGGYPGEPPVVDRLLPNTVAAENLSTVADELVGISQGFPEQTFDLVHFPVQADTLTLTVANERGDPEEWTRVPDFLDSGRDASHYTLNATTGQIAFGDGERGRIPVADSEIVAVSYRYGGGTAGNLPPGAIATPLASIIGVEGVTNALGATGGRDEQSVADAKRAALKCLRSRNRAVTAEDFAVIAREAGGVARATAIALAHPEFPGVEIPGAVHVVVVPDAPSMAIRNPTPTPDLLTHVCRYLEDYRLITTEVTVTGPTYRAIGVEATIETNPYAASGDVMKRVAEAIDEYLDPLARKVRPEAASLASAAARPGEVVAPETEQAGWPFGRDLYRSSIFGVILRVEDVLAVSELKLKVDGTPLPPEEQDKPIVLRPDELVSSSGEHDIIVRPARDR